MRWHPSDALMDPFEEMQRMMGEMPSRMQGMIKVFAPAIDMYQEGNTIVAVMPLAGVDPTKVEVEIVDTTLTVKGISGAQTEVDEKNYYRKEVRSGSFYRAVNLPVAVLKDKATATSENGILKITIPKAPEAKAKNVPVKIKIINK